LLESFDVPVLVNDSVDNGIEIHLMHLLRQQVHQIVHLADLIVLVQVMLAPLRKELLTNKDDEVAEVRVACQLLVLPRMHHASLDLVRQWTYH
jgi:hypothetical protein